MNKDVLYDLGFTKGEVEVYLALLKIGQSSIGKIVEVSRVTKSKVYDILNKLKNKGMVSSSVKDGVQFFNAAAPQFLLELVEREEKEIEKTKIELEEMLPSLIGLQTEASKQQRTEIFEGFRGAIGDKRPYFGVHDPVLEGKCGTDGPLPELLV